MRRFHSYLLNTYGGTFINVPFDWEPVGVHYEELNTGVTRLRVLCLHNDIDGQLVMPGVEVTVLTEYDDYTNKRVIGAFVNRRPQYGAIDPLTGNSTIVWNGGDLRMVCVPKEPNPVIRREGTRAIEVEE